MVPAAIEMMDALAIEAAEAAVACGYPDGAGAVLIVERDGPAAEVRAEAERVGELCARHGASEVRIAADDGRRALLWKDGDARTWARVGIIERVTNWEYARLDYRAAGTLGTDRYMDWTATFHHPGGVLRWGTDERFDDLRHLNRAGAAGWQAYDRAAQHVKDEPHRLNAIVYSMRRPIP